MPPHSVSQVLLVIPAYNEERRIEAPLRAYLAFARQQSVLRIRILVVLNGCTDGTAKVVARLAAEFPELTWMEYPEPIGKGGALLAGFREAHEAEWIGFADADGATPPGSLFGLLQHPEGDVLVGRREMSTRPFVRRAASYWFNSIVRLMLGLRTLDAQCGAKFFRATFLPAILKHTDTCDMAVDVDLLLSAQAAGAVIQERPVQWTDQPGSKVQVVRTSMLMFLSVCRLCALRRWPNFATRGLLKISEAIYAWVAGRARRGLPGAPAHYSLSPAP